MVDGNARVAKNAPQRAEGDFPVQRNGDWKALRVAGVPKPDVAALLAHRNVPETAERANQSSPEMTGNFGVIL